MRVGGAARLHGHGDVVLESCDLLLFVSQLFSEEVILSLEVQNLLRPVLLLELCKLLCCKLKLGPHILMSLLSRIEIAVNHILLQLKLLCALLARLRLSLKCLNISLLVLNKLLLFLDESLEVRDVCLELCLLGVDLCKKLVLLLHLPLSDLALAPLSLLEVRL